MARPRENLRPPHRALLATEFARASTDFVNSMAGAMALLFARRGDGHAVLVLPGFLADDATTEIMRARLRHLGYAAEGWGLGRNVGPADHVLDGISSALRRLADNSGEKVSIVGWSMGGTLGRWLALQSPQEVRTVISLGSPVRRIDPKATNVGAVYEQFEVGFSQRVKRKSLIPDRPLPVPATAIYTRADGIVPWPACIAPKDAINESVEVYGSHSGLGVNLGATLVTADRLAQPAGEWQPYATPPALHWLFPTAPND